MVGGYSRKALHSVSMELFTSVVLLMLLFPEVCCLCHGGIERMQCPMGCKCSTVELDCQFVNLDKIPELLPHTLQYVNLIGNRIQRISDRHFKGCSQLKELLLGNNLISRISADAFGDLGKLRKLDLHHNALSGWGFTAHHLSALTSLTYLDIHKTYLAYDPDYFDNLLVNVSSLETLIIDTNINETDWRPIIRLKLLTSFHVHRHVERIYNDTFEMFSYSSAPQIQTFGVHSTKLTNVDALSFVHFKNLKTLDLSFNTALGFHNMSVAWYGLQELEELRELRLEASTPFATKTINLDEDFFQYLNETRITKLILDGNCILFFKPLFHTNLPHLEYLSMTFNRIQTPWSLYFTFSKLENLTFADGSHQSRRRDYPSPEQDRSDNMFNGVGWQSYPTPLLPPTTEEMYHPGSDDDIQRFVFNFTFHVSCPPKLEILLLAEANTLYINQIPRVEVNNCSELNYFDYSYNILPKWIGPLTFTSVFKRQMTWIIQSCRGDYISPTFLNNQIPGNNQTALKLKKMDFSHNRFGAQIERDVNGSIWHQFEDAEIGELHLADNGIRLLQFNALNHLQAVQVLNLSDNALRMINATLAHMKKLTCLDLSNNMLHDIGKNTRVELDQIAAVSPLKLILTGNPLLCNCDTLPFLHWIKKTKVTLVDNQTYSCSFNEAIVDFRNLEEVILPELNLNCANKVLLITAGAIVSVALIMLVSSVCVYRHRWDIRYMCMRWSRKRKVYQLHQQENTYKYDAFVAYCSEDISWVRHQLMHNLELEGPEPRFRLCLHHRDWQPGVPIEENIEDSIESSRKTILVITKKFASSAWNEFETRVARGRSIEERLDLIVAIMLEDVPVEMMKKTLYRIVRKDTYIKWPDFEANHRETIAFWEKLREALKAPIDLP